MNISEWYLTRHSKGNRQLSSAKRNHPQNDPILLRGPVVRNVINEAKLYRVEIRFISIADALLTLDKADKNLGLEPLHVSVVEKDSSSIEELS